MSGVADGQTTTVWNREPVVVSRRRPDRPSIVGCVAVVIFVRLAVVGALEVQVGEVARGQAGRT